MKTMHPYDILAEIRGTSSKNTKLAIVKREKDNQLFRKVVRNCLDPFITFGMKKIPHYAAATRPKYKLEQAIDALASLADRSITGHAARDFVIDLLSSLPLQDAAVVERVILKDFDAGFSESTVNKGFGEDFIPVWPVMLCEKFGRETIEKHVRFPAIAQMKMDGMRVNVIVEGDKVTYFTRNGQQLVIGERFDERFRSLALGHNYVFDGELLVVDKNNNPIPRKASNGICRKAVTGNISQKEIDSLHFVLWDWIPLTDWQNKKCKIEYSQRLKELNLAIMDRGEGEVEPVESVMVDDFDAAVAVFEKYLAEGKEGLILKNTRGTWEDKRVKHQVKMKGEKEADLEVYDIIPHSKNPKLIGSLLCRTSCGKLETGVGSGLDDEDRAKDPKWWKGKIVAVVYNELIQDRKGGVVSMFLPRIVEVRADKSKANSLDELS